MGKNLPLESLRGLAALLVTLFHFKTSSPLSNNAFVDGAYLMVDFFFVLSGFVIALNYWDKIKTASDLAVFQVKRFWRLYPLHLATLLGFLGIEAAKYFFEQKTGVAANNPAFSINNGWAFVNHLFLTQAIILDKGTFNTPSWSISVEFYTYLVFAAAILLSGRFKIYVFSVLALVCGVVLFVNGGLLAYVTGLAIVRCIFSFALGVLAYRAVQRFVLPAGSWPSLILLTALVALVPFVHHSSLEMFMPLLYAAAIFAVFNMRADAALHKALSLRPLVFLGTISYSVYMVHTGIWWVITQVLRFGFKVGTYVNADGRVKIDLDPWVGTGVTLLGLAVIIGVSTLTYYLIENHFRKGLRRG